MAFTIPGPAAADQRRRSLHTELRANRFLVEIRMPLTAPD
jgi:hypothetical protein